MKVLVIGGGGREHALCWKISQSPLVDRVYCAPGNAGISKNAECIDIKPMDIESLVRFSKAEEIDITIVGPEQPLAQGIVDKFNAEKLRIFGPSKEAAVIESSKVFSKHLMRKYSIPTPFFSTFNHFSEAVNWVKEVKPPLVVKADGLAGGKGVVVCKSENEVIDTLDSIMRGRIFGEAGGSVVIEEFIEGEEVSFFVFTDGDTVIPLEPSQDHKALLDGDKGPNTGGMGAYSPAPIITEELHDKIMDRIMIPVIRALNEEGRRYKGVLYAGLMIKDLEPTVLEFNCRFGDPETQPLLMRMKSDIVPILNAVVDDDLNGYRIEWKPESSVCVVMASKGYPGDYKTGIELHGLEAVEDMENVVLFHAGTTVMDGKIVSNGGRILGVTAIGNTISESRDLAYKAVRMMDDEDIYYRTDIGKKALHYA
ncbi:MAG: phosphoribosylamine--glycine ligase [Deltaproteobacteria bacterium]|nr:phosphoribosylamine--glycine ligase [Deltaproteobacteria bacterium]